MTDIKKDLENIDTLSEAKKKEIEASVEQENEIKKNNQPASDVYGKVKEKDPETGVEIPTETSVEEAKKWVDDQNQM